LQENLLSLSEDKIKTFINNLKDYKCNYKLQQAALSMIVHNLPHTEIIRELEKAFRLIDKNGDGHLSREELVQGFKEILNKSEEEAENTVENIFKNVKIRM
jgi:calcium-dependent protein kinase